MGIRRKLRISSVAAWLCAGTAICLSARADAELKPIYWKQTVFSIPYQINRSADAQDAPVKVLLKVSRDAGINWKTLESAEPKVKGFIYNAEEDGEYWFAVQTVDRYGRSHPPADHIRPELHVVVDTQPPKLDVQAEVNSQGELVVQCQTDDPHLERESLSVGVRPQNGDFQPLSVPNADASQSGSASRPQELTFLPPLGTRIVQVRAEITDLAGNRSVSQIEVDLLSARQRPREAGAALANAPGSSAPRDAQQSGQSRQAGPSANTDSPAHAWRPVGGTAYPQAPSGALTGSGSSLIDPPGLAAEGQGRVPADNSQAWPVDEVALAPPGTPSRYGLQPQTPAVAAAAGQVATVEPLPPPKEAAQPSWTTKPASAVRKGGTGADLLRLPDAEGSADDRRVQPDLPTTDAGPPAVEEIPPGEPVRPYGGASGGPGSPGRYLDTGGANLNVAWPMGAFGPAEAQQQSASQSGGWQLVNSRTIAIDYELDSVGPWGVSEVALWGTRDGGQTWRRYAVDDDNRSPVTATVEGEGDYGFRVVVHSAGGFAAAAPQPGDPPEALVRVDLVRPQAIIQSVEQGTGNAADQILIRWSADDAQLASNPVTLYYSPQPAGPWSIVAAGLQNSGSYAWRAERHLPEQLYVRLEVRDAAGNVTTFQTAEPVVVHRPRPQVRIREVRPFAGSGGTKE